MAMLVGRIVAFRSPWQNGVAESWAGSCREGVPGIVGGEQRLGSFYANCFWREVWFSSKIAFGIKRPRYPISLRKFYSVMSREAVDALKLEGEASWL